MIKRAASIKSRRPAKPGLRGGAGVAQWHRWIGLAAAILWLIQGATGALIVFHWELSDAAIAGDHAATNLDRIEARALQLAPPGSNRSIGSIWTTAGAPDRYDISVDDKVTGVSRTVRIAGDGAILSTSNDGDFFGAFVSLHQTLLSGDIGSWVVGLSGALLLTSMVFGLAAAWPRGHFGFRVLRPARNVSRAARPLAWHRAIGFWAALPALIIAGAGVSLVFDGAAARVIGAQDFTPPARPGEARIGIAQAGRIALNAVPGSRLTAYASMPRREDATYKIRLLAPGEWRRAYGTTAVYVDAGSGKVRSVYRAVSAPFANRVMDALYAVHTGEVTGFGGRLLVSLTGLWLVTMVSLGVLSWRVRMQGRKRS